MEPAHTTSAVAKAGGAHRRAGGQVHVLVPAHNEERSVGATIRSLTRQTREPDSITVIADNCTDDTVAVARDAGAAVFTTRGNDRNKAGALNQYLQLHLLEMHPDDYLLVLDADSTLAPRFVQVAVDRLASDERLGAVGGVFLGDQPANWLEQAQANEYTRYARDIGRKQGRVMVLTGTATLFRARALLDVAEARGLSLPGLLGEVYDVAALTEDNEITLALKHLGWRLVSPRQCVVRTELMPTVADLHRQRLRWYRGAVENLGAYGWTPVTRRYWVQQALLLASVLVFGLFLLTTAASVALGVIGFSPWWGLVGLAFVVERVATVWRRKTWRGRLLAALVVPEMLYDLSLQVTFLRAAHDAVRRRPASWGAGADQAAPALAEPQTLAAA